MAGTGSSGCPIPVTGAGASSDLLVDHDDHRRALPRRPVWTTIIDVGSRATTALGMRAEQEGLALSADGDLVAHTAAGVEKLGEADGLRPEEALLLARTLTRYRRPAGATAEGGRDLLSLIGVADIEALTPDTMWPGRELSRQRLVVPIGTTEQGVPVRLDLKESAHGGMGPHGLCIGATGSGKSELLRTLVVSLAATHSPDELNLVLVDFKGGATFLGCEGLPHTSAVITNLADEAVLVERMFDAISGELNRRQEVLREAGNFANVTEYTTARLAGRDLPPLPALVIVVDEFSELLAAHPDFADLFVAVGRLGRSLHVHLLLASQRLEEGRLRGLDSHLSYRIGLKTFSAAESRQVLGVTDAHHLPARPGAGFLRHDADLTRFQAAYVSGPLERRDVSALPGGTGRVALFTGWEQFEEAETPMVVDESTTLLDAVVDRARATAEARGQRAHRVWLPPLPPVVELAGVAEDVGALRGGRYHRCATSVRTARARLGRRRGTWRCGGPQSGKSTTLHHRGVMAATHPTAVLRFYVLDPVAGNCPPRPPAARRRGRGAPSRAGAASSTGDQFIGHPEEHTFLVVDSTHARRRLRGPRRPAHRPGRRRTLAPGPPRRLRAAVDGAASGGPRPHQPPAGTETRRGDGLAHRPQGSAEAPRPPGTRARPRGPTDAARAQLQPGHRAHRHRHPAGTRPAPAGAAAPGDAAGARPRAGYPAGRRRPPPEHPVLGPGGQPAPGVHRRAGVGQVHRAGHRHGRHLRTRRDAARLVLIDHRRAHLGRVDESMLAAYSATTSATADTLRDVVTTLSARLPGPDITPAQLAARDWWTGPDIHVVIDDLDLVADHDLARLTDLLPHARDIGLHLILARKAGGIGRALFSPFLAAVRDQTPAVLLLDADREVGAVFGIRPSQPPAGTWQVRGETIGVCQVAVPPEKTEES